MAVLEAKDLVLCHHRSHASCSHQRPGRPHRPSDHGGGAGGGVAGAGDRAVAVRPRGRALFVRAGLDLAHRNRDLWPRHAVHAGGGLDAARRRPCAGRRVLRRGWPTHARQDRSRRRRAAAVAVRSSDGAARDCSGDPLAERAGEAALMPLAELLAILMVAAVIAALMAGYPVALTLAGVSLMFAVLGHILGVGGLALLGALPQRIYGIMTNDVLLAIPLFIFMGVMLERSDIAGDLLERMGRLFGSLRGGLGYSVVLVGALLAASTGIVGATAVTMGLIMLPAMMRHGYDPRLTAGTVAASATLAQIIPPSTVLVVLGDQLNNAYQAAQLAQGKFAPNVISVSDLFAGAIVPGLLLVGLYLLYLIAMAALRPKTCPAVSATAAPAATGLLEALLAPVVLIAAVLGSILYGVSTPTKAPC